LAQTDLNLEPLAINGSPESADEQHYRIAWLVHLEIERAISNF
jgi:hypothetical protein